MFPGHYGSLDLLKSQQGKRIMSYADLSAELEGRAPAPAPAFSALPPPVAVPPASRRPRPSTQMAPPAYNPPPSAYNPPPAYNLPTGAPFSAAPPGPPPRPDTAPAGAMLFKSALNHKPPPSMMKPICGTQTAKNIMGEREAAGAKVDDEDWYVRSKPKHVFGPFNTCRMQKYVSSRRSRNIRTEIRQGLGGRWRVCVQGSRGGVCQDDLERKKYKEMAMAGGGGVRVPGAREPIASTPSATGRAYASRLGQLNQAHLRATVVQEEKALKKSQERRGQAGVLSNWGHVDEHHILPSGSSFV